jgi:hypothetical protein
VAWSTAAFGFASSTPDTAANRAPGITEANAAKQNHPSHKRH